MIKVALLTLQSNSTALGLGYLISWFKKYSEYRDRVEFSIVEAPKAISTLVKPIDKICSELEIYDVVGISTITQDYNEILAISTQLKVKNIPVIFGGHHVSTLPHKLPDSAVVGILGEGEETFQKTLDLFIRERGFPEDQLAKIDGICFHGKNGQVVKNKMSERIKDVDSIPFPDRSYYSRKHFIPRIKWRNKVLGSIITSRGCPYDCVFCSSAKHWSNTIRFFSAEYVVNEIMYLYNTYKVTLVQIYDDLGTLNKRRWEEIRDLLKEKGLLGKIEFHAQCRVDVFNEKYCDLFKELNFTELDFGIESGSQRILDYLKKTGGKGCKVEQNWNVIEMCLKAGINVWAELIVGSPDETLDEVKKTLKFTEIPGVRYQICFLTPLPGTPLWQYCLKKGLVSEEMDWSKLRLEINEKTFFDRVYVCETIPKEVMWNLIKHKIDENIVKNEILNIPISLNSIYYALKMLIQDPRTNSKIYYSKAKSLYNYYTRS